MTSSPNGRPLPRYRRCFVCGKENGAGLDIQFYRSGSRVHCEWLPAARHLGYPDRVHGGVTASVLDEAMGWAPASELARLCYSIDIAVKYRRAIATERPLRVEAELVERKRRGAVTSGRIVDAEGAVYASATGLYLPLPPGRTEEILPDLYLEGVTRAVEIGDL